MEKEDIRAIVDSSFEREKDYLVEGPEPGLEEQGFQCVPAEVVNLLGNNFIDIVDALKDMPITENKTSAANLEKIPVTAAKLAIDPALMVLFLATAEMEAALQEVKADVKSIVDFLEKKEQSELYGTYEALLEIKDDYQLSRNNPIAVQSYHTKVRDIIHISLEKIGFHHKRTTDLIKKYKSSVKAVTTAVQTDNMVSKLHRSITDYQMALTDYSLAYLLDIIITENFDSAYLQNVERKLKRLDELYMEIYDDCMELIAKAEGKELDSKGMAAAGGVLRAVGRGADTLTDGIEKGFEKIKLPVRAPKLPNVAKKLGESISRKAVRKQNDSQTAFSSNRENGTARFIEAVNSIDDICNKPMELIAEDGNIYYRTTDHETEQDQCNADT